MGNQEKRTERAHVGRRDFLKGLGAIAGAPALADAALSADQQKESVTPTSLAISFTLNGKERNIQIDSRMTLLDLLRERLDLTGSKKGCDHGACGACTVHVAGKRVLSCLTLAATLPGAEVTTIEGIGEDQHLHPLQEAFLRCDAFQCGYCTPGQIMSGIACIEEGHAQHSAAETREWMSGNLCRCSAYPNILAAVRQTAGVEPAIDPAQEATVLSLEQARS